MCLMQETENSSTTAETVERLCSRSWGGFITSTCWSLASALQGPTSRWANGDQEVTQAEPSQEGPAWNLLDTPSFHQGDRKKQTTACPKYKET